MEKNNLPQDSAQNQSPAVDGSSTATSELSDLKESPDIEVHNCTLCSKSFSSGKVLRGHISSGHVQANQQHSSNDLEMKTASDGSVSSIAADAAEIPCSECDRKFRTQKSLYGHMRFHPDRPYRGMKPPEMKKLKIGPQPNPRYPESGVNRGESGGKGKAVMVSKSSPCREEEEAFDTLMMLSSGQSQPSLSDPDLDSNKKQKFLEGAAGEAIVVDDGLKLGSQPTNPSPNQITEPLSSGEKTCLSAMVQLMSGTEKGTSPTNPDQIGTGKKKALDPSQYQHSCIHCGKAFPSRYAMAGHMSIHKMKMKAVNTTVNEGVPADKGHESGKKFPCEKCPKSFKCGQALGGHKRAHFFEVKKRKGKVKGFDLNKMPDE